MLNTIFNIIWVILQWPVKISMLSWSSFLPVLCTISSSNHWLPFQIETKVEFSKLFLKELKTPCKNEEMQFLFPQSFPKPYLFWGVVRIRFKHPSYQHFLLFPTILSKAFLFRALIMWAVTLVWLRYPWKRLKIPFKRSINPFPGL